jgi:excisionase family DNA binding protein
MSCEPLISAERAAQLLGVHPKTVKRLAGDGLIPGMRIGKLWRFRESVLDSWMSAQLNSNGHPRPEAKAKGQR